MLFYNYYHIKYIHVYVTYIIINYIKVVSNNQKVIN